MELVQAWLTVYGPLGMGWVVAWYLFRDSRENRTVMLDMIKDGIQVQAELKNALRELSSYIERITE